MLDKIGKEKEPCCPTGDSSCACGTESNLLPMFHDTAADDVCCGPPPAPRSSPLERPGYKLCHYVEGFVDTWIVDKYDLALFGGFDTED